MNIFNVLTTMIHISHSVNRFQVETTTLSLIWNTIITYIHTHTPSIAEVLSAPLILTTSIGDRFNIKMIFLGTRIYIIKAK